MSDAQKTETAAGPSSGWRHSKYLALAAMLFAVAMLFIDQTIISIAAPTIQDELGLSEEGVQWIVNDYLLALSAFFLFGGRLSDIVGHKRMVVAGTVIFAVASAMCGLTPVGALSQSWIIAFRVLQGFGGAIMFPAALALVVAVFPISERGKALALFFGLTGAFTAVGPIAGGYLTEYDWRAIFWVNVPVAILAVVLTLLAKIPVNRKDESMDWAGAALVAVGMALAVLGFQQSSAWGWSSPLTIGCIAAGLIVLAIFVYVETKVAMPLLKVRIFRGRAFSVDNLSLFLISGAFIPVFFFISLYAQISLGYSATNSGLFLMWFFLGFVIAAQVGGRILDKTGAKSAMIVGTLVATVGFVMWAQRLPDLNGNALVPWIIITGGGIGLMLGPANTDAVNRAIDASYGEVSGATQTIRYFGSSVGLAILGTMLISVVTSRITTSLIGFGVPESQAADIASRAASGNSSGGSGGGISQAPAAMQEQIMKALQGDFADAVQYVFYGMAVITALAFIVTLFHPGGKVEAQDALPGGRAEAQDALPGGGG